MEQLLPTKEEWQALYKAMRQIEKLEPWKSIGETNIFGIQNPDTGELGFVSVMGMWEEYTAVALYLGAAGLYEFLNFEATGAELHHLVAAEGLVSIRHLQASFEERKFLAKEDHAVIKNLGLKFRNTWPFFRSYEAGLSPWFLNAGEVRFLTYALEQVPDIVFRFQRDVFLLECDEVEHYLVRVAHKDDAALAWHDEVLFVPPPEEKLLPPAEVDQTLVNAIKKLPKGRLEVEIDFFMLTQLIADRERPHFPYILMIADSQTGRIIGQKVVAVETTHEVMYTQVPMNILRQFASLGAMPRRIDTRPQWLYQMLKPLLKELKVELNQDDYLPALEDVQDGLMEFTQLDKTEMSSLFEGDHMQKVINTIPGLAELFEQLQVLESAVVDLEPDSSRLEELMKELNQIQVAIMQLTSDYMSDQAD